jgi:inorganic pyrophosphatase
MDLSKISAGRNPPHDLNAFIEIPPGGEPVKYEFDKQENVLFADLFLHTSMRYPANYGFVPNSLRRAGILSIS